MPCYHCVDGKWCGAVRLVGDCAQFPLALEEGGGVFVGDGVGSAESGGGVGVQFIPFAETVFGGPALGYAEVEHLDGDSGYYGLYGWGDEALGGRERHTFAEMISN